MTPAARHLKHSRALLVVMPLLIVLHWIAWQWLRAEWCIRAGTLVILAGPVLQCGALFYLLGALRCRVEDASLRRRRERFVGWFGFVVAGSWALVACLAMAILADLDGVFVRVRNESAGAALEVVLAQGQRRSSPVLLSFGEVTRFELSPRDGPIQVRIDGFVAVVDGQRDAPIPVGCGDRRTFRVRAGRVDLERHGPFDR